MYELYYFFVSDNLKLLLIVCYITAVELASVSTETSHRYFYKLKRIYIFQLSHYLVKFRKFYVYIILSDLANQIMRIFYNYY